MKTIRPSAVAAGFVLALGLILVSGAGAWAYEETDVAQGGSISGVARYSGEAPAPQPIKVDKDVEYCGKKPKMTEDLLVSKAKELKNAVVYIEKIEKGKKIGEEKVVLENKDCRYEPHVQAATVGATIEVVNSDPVLHNTHTLLNKTDTVFNVALPTQGQRIPKKLKKAGVINTMCDAGHHWMAAYIVVVDNPYHAVSDASGKFSIKDVPPGQYKLTVWHEKLGTKSVDVTVEAGKDAVADVGF